MLWLIVIAVAWVACGVICYGATLAQAQREYPEIAAQYYRSHVKLAWTCALFGPCTLGGHWMAYGFNRGLMFRNPHKRAKA